jgi:glycogen synthase
MKPKSDYFFETSWEVCNKVGGIYTVIASKVRQMQLAYKSNYFTVGPYFPNKIGADIFKEMPPPDFLKTAFESLHKMGIRCYYGNWQIDGDPNAILIDYSPFRYRLNDFKKEYWEKFKIDSLNSQYHDYDEPILWSTCVGILLESVKAALPDKKVAAQFHEWLSGGGILYLKSRGVKVGTIFTTHATMLGRTMAGNNMDLYGLLGKVNPEEQAYKFGIQAKFHTERACAQNVDAFTTVSEITGMEALHFLGKKPDVLLPNGLDSQQFPTFDEASIKHKQLKGKLKKFLLFYFFPYYDFDLDEALMFFLAGRYEFQNKGIDLYIDALGQLNDKLKKEKSAKTVIAFIWVPTGTKEIKPELIENRTYFEDLNESVHDQMDTMKDRLLYGLLSKKTADEEFLLGKPTAKELERKVARLKRKGNPPICTHNIYNEENDTIIKAIRARGLNNTSEDRVKIIFYPIYLNGADQLTDLAYYEAIMACHLGVFPSYYEPWGYTPMEAGAMGIASVTTDLSGFGRYVQKSTEAKDYPGIFILSRQNRTYEDVLDQLYQVFAKFTAGNKQDRIENKMQAKKLADIADWNNLANFYIQAHNLAVDKNG